MQNESSNQRIDDKLKVQIALPADDNNGWLGWIWIFAAMVPVSIGGAVLSPTINSAITKRIQAAETGAILGASASMSSLANALTPIIGGVLFQFFGTTLPFLLTGLLKVLLLALALRRIRAVPAPVSPPAVT